MSHAAEPCQPAVARIVSLQGTVAFRPNETEPWVEATLNANLCVGYWIRVGPFSRAALALPNDSVLRLDQQTTLRLRAETEERRSLLDLFLGTLHLFSHRPRALEIDTPFVNAATEGTEFQVRVGADRTEIIVFEGRILAQNPDGELLVASGQAAVAAAGEAPRPQIIARPRDAVAWTLYYPPILAALAEREPAPRGLPPGLQTAVDRVAANDYPGALRALDTVRDGARDARYWAYRAGALLNVGRVDEARDAIDRALALDPQAGEALAQRAIIALVQDRRDEALADAGQAVELSPDSAAVRIALSYAQQATFQLEAARATLREAVQIAPENALAWARLSEIELSFGELRAALEAANRAVALAPELSRTHTVLGFADLARFDVGEAKTAFERAIDLDSADPLPRLGLGLAMIRQSDLEQGRNEIEVAVALDPDNSLLRSYLGKAFFEEKRDRPAGEQYAIAKRLDPLDPTPWLYDAIRLQTENRPVEALRDLNRSIALNDNRAVFRSSLLLDEDLATRQVSLARIYDDLGFERVGLLEATKSLSLHPANYSAHRFLSDIYLGQPRVEIARVSELLQAQLLQPININPIQPSIADTNLSIASRGGPTDAALNELTPLFERNQVQLNASGLVGNHHTFGGEGVASVLYNRYSLSGGGAHFETDGFRRNNDIDDDIYDGFAQVAITPELNIQAEVRRRDLNEGDIALDFDPDDFSATLRRDLDHNMARAGVRYSPTSRSDFLFSFIYSDREEQETNTNTRNSVDDDGYQIESQHLFRHKFFSVVTGLGHSEIDRDNKSRFEFTGFPPITDRTHSNIRQTLGYIYGNITLPEPLTWTVGLSVDDYEQEDLEVQKANPKFGVQWNLTDDLRVRGTVFRTVKPALVTNRTIEPTQVAGFNQLFDDVNATEAWQYGVGLDWSLAGDIFLGAEAVWRDLNVPILQGSDASFENQDEQTYRAYAFWTALLDVSVTAEIVYDHLTTKEGVLTDARGFPEDLRTFSVPLAIRYFSPLGFFGEFGATFVDQEVKRSPASTLSEGDDTFTILDASIGYRFPNRMGIASFEVNNLLDKRFKYQDDNFREFRNEPIIGPYIPDRTFVGRITVNF